MTHLQIGILSKKAKKLDNYKNAAASDLFRNAAAL